ncbi:5-carboxymethyl-2-hydroxymuconate isomerase [Cupriavidus sp. USMAA2-4]|uniref:5-carboxymethyl-2-hydroxymuconate isomerase n=1 Tax=Cupriavidus malaysiensis TaxID=367825 RepID=A0ABM6FAS2_9BURK|nr:MULTISPECIES: fumarylacetoacetate hydrolase family protein [Cupriavidus]AOY95656.1 5-carboxymethyl-2-hydroxymuconate isomerase [Cupriavidus sp. USMAA2-4]AOZ01464.1 5-carboxymethyl-2-hydroxymuconate isomerase [Cupriavidus sp. USMAHM13]AOZ08805.1 5-carboxymethyl-2-hydroxymuconate isomerase [Cupriavidus malaysiensis]
MKLISFSRQGANSFGAVVNEGVVDLGARLGLAELGAALRQSGLDAIQELAARSPADFALAEIDAFRPVVADPDKILCAGLNYDEHVQETRKQRTERPTIFLRVAASQTGHEQAIVLPPESERLDYEGEIAVVIGKGGRRIAEDKAYAHIAGFACYNDGSIRDWQLHTSQWGPGKNFQSTGAFGPALVTRDEIGENEVLTLETRLNGQVMQHATTDMLIFSIPTLIAYCSSFVTLAPGDVIVTGTPGGVGAKRNPPVFMKDGDVVEVEVSKLGVLRNPVRAE